MTTAETTAPCPAASPVDLLMAHNEALLKKHNIVRKSSTSPFLVLEGRSMPTWNPCTVLVVPATAEKQPYIAELPANITPASFAAFTDNAAVKFESVLTGEGTTDRYVEMSCQVAELKEHAMPLLLTEGAAAGSKWCKQKQKQQQQQQGSKQQYYPRSWLSHNSSTDLQLEAGMFGFECVFFNQQSPVIQGQLPVNQHIGNGVRGPVIIAGSVGVGVVGGWIILPVLHMPAELKNDAQLMDLVSKCVRSSRF